MSNNVTEKKWWQSAVVYQIYPKSFQDSNGDGVGDLRGIMERLEYLGKLGIDAIWLSPVCKSPQADNGYDISDYQDIDPMFGSVEDMEALIKEAKKYNIRIIMDLVLNHTSNKHRWFEEAKKSKDNPYHDYYVWRDGEEGVEPNDMKAVFGGSAWEWVPEIKQYYFHQFLPEQPDLNWENPQVRKEIYDMILWWMEKGVGGFRLDVIDQIAKEPDKKITINGPRLHEYFREMSKETFQKGDLITVGEAWGADPERAKLYSNPDGSEFSMVFQFEHIGLDQQEGKDKWDLAPLPFLKLKQIMNRWQTELYNCGWNSLFWNNHDLPRIVSRWGNDKEDVMNSIYAKGRDNARTPMQWDDTENAGFTTGTPWIKVNDNYKTINAKSQVDDPDSIFNCYRKLVSFRKEYPVLVDGSFKLLLAEDENIFAYERKNADETLLVVCNFYGNTVKMPLTEETEDMELLISNYKETEDSSVLRPYEARMYYKK